MKSGHSQYNVYFNYTLDGYLFRATNKIYFPGVTSWGYGCGLPNKPGVYAHVSKYVSWIRSHVEKHFLKNNAESLLPPKTAASNPEMGKFKERVQGK